MLQPKLKIGSSWRHWMQPHDWWLLWYAAELSAVGPKPPRPWMHCLRSNKRPAAGMLFQIPFGRWEGDSGSGKSTLATVLADLRVADSGLLLLDGLDRQSVTGESWRRHVVSTPQFHENHVLMGPLAFNLLMGRRWPPQQDDLAEAAQICGSWAWPPPAGGLFQLVGETGWQLSHGEQSRVYLARALLQGTDLVILDETLAALDPKTLQQTADCVLSAASSLLVVAHP